VSPQLRKRLPLLILAAAGLWLWRSDLVVQTREVSWSMPPDRAAIRSVELQLWGPEETLLKREERHFSSGPPEELRQEVSLGSGRYVGRAFVTRADGGTSSLTQEVVVPSSRP
jgi:hypothetical protein